MTDEQFCAHAHRVILDKISMAQRVRISSECARRHIDVSVRLDHLVDAFLVTLYSFQPGKKDVPVVISYPKTWWDSFKARWFPKWLLRRHPVNMVKHQIERGCTYPTIQIGQTDHFPLAFMQPVKMDYFTPSQDGYEE